MNITKAGCFTTCLEILFFMMQVFAFDYSLSPGAWQSFVTIGSCNHLMRIISTYVDNTKKSEIT